MRCDTTSSDIIHKDVVVIGNGPSGIALSYMLSGNLPYIVSADHPDEMLSARLTPVVGKCLLEQDLENLAAGLEGRSTNPVSLLLDALLHPCADIGVDMEPLVEFRKTGKEIDHIVLGKGPPGGSWHTMDPHILTLSLGSWMTLPGLPLQSKDSGEKRAFACNVATYYARYVDGMNLSKHFQTNILVTAVKPYSKKPRRTSCSAIRISENKTDPWLKKIDNEITNRTERCLLPSEQKKEVEKTCLLTNAIKYILSRTGRKTKTNRCCKRPRDHIFCNDQSPTRKVLEISQDNQNSMLIIPPNVRSRKKDRSISFCCDSQNLCDSFYSKSSNDNSRSLNDFKLRNSHSLNFDSSQEVPFNLKSNLSSDCDQVNWVVETFDLVTGKSIIYTCKYLVLATGASDRPNRLEVFRENKHDPSWLFHSLRNLEMNLDGRIEEEGGENIDPVLIVGAGLSAADAVIATRGRNIPVIHVFRNKSADLNKQLPENMYPEYHKVHQMMQDEGSTYPLYKAYPEYTLTDFDELLKTVILTSKTGERVTLKVSCAAILIGSRPDLTFLPETGLNLGIKKGLPIDCKTNPIDINKLTHLVNGYDNLLAIGPLAGDNFVRFIPGGSLAVTAELYRRSTYSTEKNTQS